MAYLSEAMMSLCDRLHDEDAPLFPEEGIELGHFRACAGWSVYHKLFLSIVDFFFKAKNLHSYQK